MIKTESIDAVAAESKLDKADARRCLDALLSTIIQTVARGEEMTLAGFGKFKAREIAARVGRNPRTGELIEIAPSRKIMFKPAKASADALAISK